MSQYDINFREYWRILKKRKVLVTFVTIVFSIFITFFVYLRAPTPLYTTSCLIEFKRAPALHELYQRYDPSAADDIETQITVVKSYPVFERVVEILGLVPQSDMKEDGNLNDQVIAIIEGLQSKVKISREGVSAILKIEVTDTNPTFAQKLANTVALAYKETHAIQLSRRNKEQLKYIVSQLGDVRKKLRSSEDEVNRFAQENELVSIDLQSENLLAQAKDLQDRIRKLKEEKVSLDDVFSKLESYIKDPFAADHNFYSTEASEQYRSTNDALVGLILKRESLLRSFTPRHPDVLAISDRIIEHAKKMSFLLKTQIMNIQKKERELKEELQNVSKQTKVLMEKRLEFDRLKRTVDLYNEMTVLLERKNQEALIKEAEKPETIHIVKPALLPNQPINSTNTVSAGVMSVLIGVVLGFVIAFIVETFDTSLGAIEDVEETLGTKVLGVIPQGDAQDIQEELMSRDPETFKDFSFKSAFGAISHFLPKSMISESFRALRTNIQYKDPGKKARTLAITSSSPEEGKSMVATNLAITMAQGGMKTLLVGSDLRKPGIDRSFGVERAPGLTDVLLGEHSWRDTVKTVTDIILGKMSWDEIMLTPGLDNLHIITSGTPPPNPAELIDSKRLEEFIEEVKKEYDVIIFDSSPILSTADAAILGMKVDGVLLVYRVGSISRGLLKRTASQLEQVQANLMGVIINGMKPDISPDFQGYKYYTYYYSYGDGEDRKKKRFKKPQTKKPLIMIAAIACLAVGFLWQSGLIASFKQSLSGKTVESVAVKPATSGMKEPVQKPKTATEKLTESTTSLTKPVTPLQTSAKRLEEPTGKLEISTEVPIRKMPIPKSPVESQKNTKPITPQSPKPGPVAASPLGKTMPKAIKLEGKKNEPKEKAIAAYVPPEIPPTMVKPEKPPVDGEAVHSEPLSVEPSPSTEIRTVNPSTELRTVGPPNGMPESNKPDSRENTPKYPFTIQLGSFRTLVQAKNAVTLYKEKGFSPFWSEVNLGGNEKWFRVYTGLFETREQANKYREEQNLLKSLVRRTPNRPFDSTVPDEQVPEGNQRKKIPDKPISDKSDSKPLGDSKPEVEGSIEKKAPAIETSPDEAPADQTPAKKAQAVQAPADPVPSEHAQKEKRPSEMGGSIPDQKKLDTQGKFPGYPFSIQLGSFRTLERARRAVASYIKTGLPAYWSEVGRKGNNRRFRVYTGFFQTREQADKYRKEMNLLKSLVKRTPKNVFSNTPTNQQVPEDKKLSKVPDPKHPEGSTRDNKTSVTKSSKPVPVSLKGNGEKQKIKFDRLKPSITGSKPAEKDEHHGEASTNKSMGKVTMKISPRPVYPEKKSPKDKTTTVQKSGEKPKDEMTSWFSWSFSGMASNADLKSSESRGEYPKYPYSIQLGSFRTLAQAKKAVASYRKKGLTAYWSEADREGNERWFRVYTGSFGSRDEANKYRKEQNLLKSLVKKTPYSAFLGTYTDKEVLEDQTLLLTSLDCIPYAIEEQDGKYRLFVGAFLTRKVAEEKRLALESMGIQSQVISR